MSKTILEYAEKHHILEVDGIEYTVPQRTAALEKKIRRHDEAVGGKTEYESNIEMLEILFGEAAAKQMFPDGDNTNLDKLALCARYAISLFMADFNAIQTDDLNKRLEELKPVTAQLDKLSKAVEKTNDITAVRSRKKK